MRMPDALFQHFTVFQSIFREFQEIIDFQKTFDKDIRATILSPTATLETMTEHSREMKVRYSSYSRLYEKCLGLMQSNREYFNEIRKHTKSGLMINDELSRPTRGIPNMKLYFTDFVKCAKKDGKDRDAEVYDEMLFVLNNVGKTVDDALLLEKIGNLPNDFQIEEQGCCVKSGAVDLIKTHRSLLRKLLGMKASCKFNSGHMFLFEKCLLICIKIESKKRKGKKYYRKKEKFRLEALIQISDLADFLDDDYYDIDDKTLKIFEKQTNLVHLISLDSKDSADDWSEKIVAEVGKLNTE